MKKLKTKQWLSVLSIAMCIAFFQGCVTEVKPAYFTFLEPTKVVEVNTDIKSFRVEVKWIRGDQDMPRVDLDTINTTASHNVHFINEVGFADDIGDFTPMDSDHMYYKNVELLPDNITSEVSIHYYLYNNTSDQINTLEVILRPKANNN